MDNKYLSWVSLVTFSSALILILYCAYLALWPFQILKLESNYSKTCKSVYYTGEILTYRNHYTKYKAISGQVVQSFVDGLVYQLPDRITDNPVGHNDTINATVLIPHTLPSGEYKLSTTIIYHVNLFKDIRYTAKSNIFTVINTPRDNAKLNSNISEQENTIVDINKQ